MKNIVVCCDGTGNEYGTNNTNVVTTCELAEESERQCRYYDPGVGTGGWVYEEEEGSLRAAMDQATGHGLRKNVEDAYRFLMQVHEAGDRVFLFGFSRGAFTVRSLAGMLHRCGLLRPTAAIWWSTPRSSITGETTTQRTVRWTPASGRPSPGRARCTSSGCGTPSSP